MYVWRSVYLIFLTSEIFENKVLNGGLFPEQTRNASAGKPALTAPWAPAHALTIQVILRMQAKNTVKTP